MPSANNANPPSAVEAHVIFMSGFVDRKDFSRDAPLWSEFIQKPFRPGELLSCVQGVLEASSARARVAGGRSPASGERLAQ